MHEEDKPRRRTKRIIISASIPEMQHCGLASWSRKAPEKKGAGRGGKERVRYVSLRRFFRVVASTQIDFPLSISTRDPVSMTATFSKSHDSFFLSFCMFCFFSIFFLALAPTTKYKYCVSYTLGRIYLPGNYGKSKQRSKLVFEEIVSYMQSISKINGHKLKKRIFRTIWNLYLFKLSILEIHISTHIGIYILYFKNSTRACAHIL